MDFETLELKIVHKSSDAAASVRDLTGSLRELKSALNGLKGAERAFDGIAKGIKRAVDASRGTFKTGTANSRAKRQTAGGNVYRPGKATASVDSAAIALSKSLTRATGAVNGFADVLEGVVMPFRRMASMLNPGQRSIGDIIESTFVDKALPQQKRIGGTGMRRLTGASPSQLRLTGAVAEARGPIIVQPRLALPEGQQDAMYRQLFAQAERKRFLHRTTRYPASANEKAIVSLLNAAKAWRTYQRGELIKKGMLPLDSLRDKPFTVLDEMRRNVEETVSGVSKLVRSFSPKKTVDAGGGSDFRSRWEKWIKGWTARRNKHYDELEADRSRMMSESGLAAAAETVAATAPAAPTEGAGRSRTRGGSNKRPIFEQPLWKQFLRIARYRALYSAISMVSNALREGVGNLYGYSKSIGGSFAASMDAATSSLLTMKNSLAVAVAPAIQALIPVLQTVVSWVVTAANAISQFFALLNGAGSWTKATTAVKEYGEAVGGAGGAAKNVLADFDELNVLSRGGGGGGGGGALDYSSMFEEVTVFSDKMKRVVQFVKDAIAFVRSNLNWILPAVLSVIASLKTLKFANSLSAFSKMLGNKGSLKDSLGTLGGMTLMFFGLTKAVPAFFKEWNDGVTNAQERERTGGMTAIVAGLGLMFGKAGLKAGLAVDAVSGFGLALKDIISNGPSLDNLGAAIGSIGSGLLSIGLKTGNIWLIVAGGIAEAISFMIRFREEIATVFDMVFGNLKRLDMDTVVKEAAENVGGTQTKLAKQLQKAGVDVPQYSVEELLTYIDAKTENPNFDINSALDAYREFGFEAVEAIVAGLGENEPELYAAVRAMMNNVRGQLNATRLSLVIKPSMQKATFEVGKSRFTIGGANVSTMATGGTINRGELFIANEAGPELVGRIGGSSGVANQNQIADIISDQMARNGGGVSSAEIASAVANALKNVVMYVDGDAFGRISVKSINSYQARSGRVELRI